ncbi:response regulator, partial [Myxococcota bacterium]|nr:response regulator [Myxococcota bacterium]
MSKTILVVEDDKSVARWLEDVLTAEGFDVVVERDGESALATFGARKVDLMITDVLVPKLKGFDLIARVREDARGAALPIVVVSGVYRSAMHRDRITAKHAIVAYLDKPLDLDALLDVLHDVFSSAYPT